MFELLPVSRQRAVDSIAIENAATNVLGFAGLKMVNSDEVLAGSFVFQNFEVINLLTFGKTILLFITLN